jgi:succinate-semialdehyde dehydrogenase/glutarate-semialdehyde dehydrogenase
MENYGWLDRLGTLPPGKPFTTASAREVGLSPQHLATAPDAPGHFYPPTVLANVQEGDTILREEIFGPVASIVTWRDDDLIRQVNDTEYGLAAYVFAGDLGRALWLGDWPE